MKAGGFSFLRELLAGFTRIGAAYANATPTPLGELLSVVLVLQGPDTGDSVAHAVRNAVERVWGGPVDVYCLPAVGPHLIYRVLQNEFECVHGAPLPLPPEAGYEVGYVRHLLTRKEWTPLSSGEAC